ncbi:MAG: sugar phosphate isomerase/epimerase family protein [Saccharofermentanales bacterium]
MKQIKYLLLIAIPIMISNTSASPDNKEAIKNKEALNNITLGVIVSGNNPEEEFKKIKELGFSYCQLGVAEYSPELAKRIRESIEKYKVHPTTLICMGPGKYAWNFTEGPATIGLVPREFREARIKRLHEGIDFCKEVGIPAVHTHFGFIPENPKDSLYVEFIKIMKEIGKYALNRGIDVYFETGQETPITLLRAITDIGTGNLFINYDLANMVMYGKSNSLDGLKILNKYVKAIHAKDGKYPTNPYELGKEVPIPQGDVNFPAIVAYFKQINFKGNITIEYEIAEKNYEYIVKTKKYLEKLFSTTN